MNKKAPTDPYWHMVDLFYKQLDGMRDGFLAKVDEDNEILQNFDTEYGFKMMNFIADIFTNLEIYHMRKSGNIRRVRRARPSCSVLIKYFQDKNDIFVGHNTWHEYSALGYRYVMKHVSVLLPIFRAYSVNQEFRVTLQCIF